MEYGLMFYAVAALALFSAVIVVVSRNIIHSAFSLLFSLLGVGLLYAMLSADFLAVIQLMLYVGGILVLILFAIMLTNRLENVKEANPASPRGIVFLLCGGVFAGLVFLALNAPWKLARVEPISVPTTRTIGQALLGSYLLPFEVVSVLLLVGLIGAVVVARRENLPESGQK